MHGSSAATAEPQNAPCSHAAKSNAATTSDMQIRTAQGVGNGVRNLRICNRLQRSMSPRFDLETSGQPSQLRFATTTGASIPIGLQWPDVLAFLGGALVLGVLALIATDYAGWF
jgi:hypothetical protein